MLRSSYESIPEQLRKYSRVVSKCSGAVNTCSGAVNKSSGTRICLPYQLYVFQKIYKSSGATVNLPEELVCADFCAA